MNQTEKNKSIICKKKSFLNLSISDENFEPPQLSSTPFKTNKNNFKRVLIGNNSLNISIINKQDQKTKVYTEIDSQLNKNILPIREENYDREPKLFCSDPEDESSVTENTALMGINDSDDKWMTLSDTFENKSCSNVSDLFLKIENNVEVKYDKPPRYSYFGKKRNRVNLYKDDEVKEKMEIEITKTDMKPKPKQKIDPQEEAFIRSINEHFSDVETSSLIVE